MFGELTVWAARVRPLPRRADGRRGAPQTRASPRLVVWPARVRSARRSSSTASRFTPASRACRRSRRFCAPTPRRQLPPPAEQGAVRLARSGAGSRRRTRPPARSPRSRSPRPARTTCCSGPPGTGKTMLARRLPTILPPLEPARGDRGHARSTVAGRAAGGRSSPPALPRAAPHDLRLRPRRRRLAAGARRSRASPITASCSSTSCGVRRAALEALRQPLEDGVVAIVRGQRTVIFPTRFQLVASTNPCPCGHAGEPAATAPTATSHAIGESSAGRCSTAWTCSFHMDGRAPSSSAGPRDVLGLCPRVVHRGARTSGGCGSPAPASPERRDDAAARARRRPRRRRARRGIARALTAAAECPWARADPARGADGRRPRRQRPRGCRTLSAPRWFRATRNVLETGRRSPHDACDACLRRTALGGARCARISSARAARPPPHLSVLSLSDDRLIARSADRRAIDRLTRLRRATARASGSTRALHAICRHDERYPQRLREAPTHPRSCTWRVTRAAAGREPRPRSSARVGRAPTGSRSPRAGPRARRGRRHRRQRDGARHRFGGACRRARGRRTDDDRARKRRRRRLSGEQARPAFADRAGAARRSRDAAGLRAVSLVLPRT